MDILSLTIDPKYKKWLKTIYDGGDLHPSFIYMCDKHKRLNDKIPVEYRDIYKFKTIEDFVYYVDTLESETDKEEMIKKNGSQTIYENDDFIVKRVFNEETMKLYGKGTKWCISSDDNNQWERYTKKGDVFFLVLSKKLPYGSQFNKFIVQLSTEKSITIWDRADMSYHSHIFDLINLDKDVFSDHYNLEIISTLYSHITKEEIINILENNNAIIAGGALTSVIKKEKINDFDIWFSNEDDYKRAINEFDSFYIDKIRGNNRTFFSMNNSKHTTFNAITYTIDNMRYQFISPTRYEFGGVGEIIKQFDFICVMCGVDMKNKKLIYDNNFFSDANSKRIRINPTLKAPASLLDRIIKYTRKGFTLSKSSQRDALKLLSKVTEQEIDDITLTMY